MIWGIASLLAACPPPVPCVGVQGCPPPPAEIESVPLSSAGIPANSNRVVVLYCAETELPFSAFSVAVDGTGSTFTGTHLAYPVPASYRGAIQIEPDDVAVSTIELVFTSSLGAAPVTVAVNAGDDTTPPSAPEIVRFALLDLTAFDEELATRAYGFELELGTPSEPNLLFVIDTYGESTFRSYATTSTTILEYGVVANPGDSLAINVRAMDPAGNVSQVTSRSASTPKGGGGCGCATASSRPSGAALVTSLAALLLWRAARRSTRSP